MSQSDPPWLVVNAQPNREQTALAHLSRQGFEPYCPMLSKRIRHARKTETVLRPLFPGYLFVAHAGRGQQWRPILSTIGVRTLVRHGDAPCLLDAAVIAAVRARETGNAIAAEPARFQIGQSVTITDGPLEGLIAEVASLDDRERVVVLLDLLKRSVRVTIDASNVTAA